MDNDDDDDDGDDDDGDDGDGDEQMIGRGEKLLVTELESLH